MERGARRRPIEHRQPEELRRINRCLVARPERQFVKGQEAVAAIEAHETEDLAALRVQPSNRKSPAICG